MSMCSVSETVFTNIPCYIYIVEHSPNKSNLHKITSKYHSLIVLPRM